MSLGKVPWMVEPKRYEPRAEHAAIHGNPESGNHQVPPETTYSLMYLAL